MTDTQIVEEVTITKTCNICNVNQPISEFEAYPAHLEKYSPICKTCSSKIKKHNEKAARRNKKLSRKAKERWALKKENDKKLALELKNNPPPVIILPPDPNTIYIDDINNPEYRWYHKKELSSIMPYGYERAKHGLIVLDYAKLRQTYLSKIKEIPRHNLDWDRFKKLIDLVPNISSKSNSQKTKLSPKDMYHFELRDRCECYLCETISRYTQFHHIIRDGGITDKNIVTLCKPCHKLVHLALFAAGHTSDIQLRHYVGIAFQRNDIEDMRYLLKGWGDA